MNFESATINNSVIIVLVLVLSLYITDLTTDYPDILHDIVEEPLYKLIILLTIFYISYHNYQIGLLLSIILVLLITNIPMVSEMETNDTFINGPPVSNCSTYDSNQIYRTGTAYYPLQDDNNNIE